MSRTAIPRRVDDRTILVQARAEGNGVIGDGVVEITTESPDYAAYDEFLKEVAVEKGKAAELLSKGYDPSEARDEAGMAGGNETEGEADES